MIAALDLVIRESLVNLVTDVFGGTWYGREREVVSLYAFGHLQALFREGSVLHHPAQIALDGAVPQLPGPDRKDLVCKDVVIWPEQGMTCWNKDKEPVNFPIAIVEWKVNKPKVSQRDVKWLCDFSAEKKHFVGYAVCLDLEQRQFRLSCTRVQLGRAQAEWLVT
jgi:hypothetical protein